MNLEGLRNLARTGRLYPSLILYGGTLEDRCAAALDLSRTLLCLETGEDRPCGICRHCSRIHWEEESKFHPDFRILKRDLTSTTSVGAARDFLKLAQQSPFEARGQVFWVQEAETLSVEAANAFLKILEEPPTSAPRNFFLLAQSRQDLLPTLRSRSWSLYLGQETRLSADRVEPLVEGLRQVIRTGTGGLQAQAMAQVMLKAGLTHFKDLRDKRGFSLAAAAVTELAMESPNPLRSRLLDLAHALLEAPNLRLRSISAERILEALVARFLLAA